MNKAKREHPPYSLTEKHEITDLIEDAKKDLEDSRDCDDVCIREDVRNIFVRDVYSQDDINNLFDKISKELFDKDNITLSDMEQLMMDKLKGDLSRLRNNINRSIIFIQTRHTNY